MFGVSGIMLVMTVVLVIAAGGLATYLLRNDRFYQITLVEFVIAAGIIVLVMLPSVSFLGSKIAQASAVGGYVEFWNGSLVKAEKETIRCSRDGSCRHEYDCDSYTVWVPKTHTRSVPDGKGGTRTETYTTMEEETRWRRCPYATQETTYWVEDSFGDMYTLGDDWFDTEPVRWRNNKAVPSDVSRGTPPQWAKAKANIDAGDPDFVVKVNKYKNYLLASQDSLLKRYSDQIAEYKKAGLLVPHTKNLLDDPIYNSYMADKVVYAGGVSVEEDVLWQQALGRLNSRLGNERQGDLHVLMVPAEKVSNPDEFTAATLAYWQSDTFGKKALAKNTVMLVLGVDLTSYKVVWSRAKTGIPEGNGALLTALSTQLEGADLEPHSLLGWPQAKPTEDGLSFVASNGLVERLMLEEYPFLRPCMDCKDKGDNGSGYVYLKSSALISTTAQVVICFFVFLISCGIFWLMAMIDLVPWVRGLVRLQPDEPQNGLDGYWSSYSDDRYLERKSKKKPRTYPHK